jgi:hypothetical protein
MVAEFRTNFDISDEQALYIREVTEEKTKDRAIQATVAAYREDHFTWRVPSGFRSTGENSSRLRRTRALR